MEISKFPKQKSQCDSLISRGIRKKWEITVFPSYSKLATLPDSYLIVSIILQQKSNKIRFACRLLVFRLGNSLTSAQRKQVRYDRLPLGYHCSSRQHKIYYRIHLSVLFVHHWIHLSKVKLNSNILVLFWVKQNLFDM